jgi:hypothetical protein
MKRAVFSISGILSKFEKCGDIQAFVATNVTTRSILLGTTDLDNNSQSLVRSVQLEKIFSKKPLLVHDPVLLCRE